MKTNQELVKEWIEDSINQGNVASEHTLINYQREVPAFLDYCNKSALEVVRVDVIKYKNECLQEQRKLSDGTVNLYIKIIRIFYNYLIDTEQYSLVNPTHRVKCKCAIKQDRYLTEREVEIILEECDKFTNRKDNSFKLKTFFMLLATTGLRYSEALSIEYEKIERVVDNGEEIGYYVVTGKGNKERKFTILPNVLKMIDEYYTKHRGYSNEKVLFVNESGGIWQNSSVNRTLKSILSKAGIKDYEKIHIHTFRHTFASRLINDNVNIMTVKELLGHSDISTTQRYVHVSDENKLHAVQSVFGN